MSTKLALVALTLCLAAAAVQGRNLAAEKDGPMETTVVLSGGAPAMAPDADVGLAPAPAPAGAGAGITLAELATHATPEDAWMAIDGVVYDVTAWIPIHPGGPAILAAIGTDASAMFRSVHGDDVPEAMAYLGAPQVPEVGPLVA